MPGKGRKSLAKPKLICGQCKMNIKEENDDYIECDKCEKIYHLQCTKLDKRQFDHFVKNERAIFECHLCEGEDERNIKTELCEIKTKLNKLDQLSQIQESIQFMAKQYDTILKGVAENKKKLHELEKENRSLRKEIVNLKSSVKIINDERVKNNCIVRGLEVSEGVTAKDSIVELSKGVGVALEPQYIDDAYFIQNNKGKNSNLKKTVIVKFSSRAAKDKLMEAKPKLKESHSDVYIYDFLSKETLQLLQYAKTLKDVGYNHVYARYGRIYYKRSDLSRPQIIHSEDDVDQILLKATTMMPGIRSRPRNPNTIAVEPVDGDDIDIEDDDLAYVSPV